MFISDLIYDKICEKSINFWKTTADRQLCMSIVRYSRLHPNFESNKFSFEMETQRTNTNSEPTEFPRVGQSQTNNAILRRNLSSVAVVVFHRGRILEERVKHKSKSR